MKKHKSNERIVSSDLQEDQGAYNSIYSDPHDEKTHLENSKQVHINAHMARWFYDHRYKQHIWSDGVYEILELNPQKTEADYYSFLEAIHPEDRHIRIRVNDELQETSKPIEITYRLLFKNERIKWINEICNTNFDQQGHPLRSFGTIQDITKYKLTEENFKRKEERINSLIEQFPLAVAICQNNKFTILNQSGKRIFRIDTHSDLIGKSIFDVVHPDSKSLFSEKLESVNQGLNESTFESRLIRQDGDSFDAEVTLIPTIFRGSATIQFIANDISRQKETENALRLTEEKFNYLSVNLSAVLWTIDLAGNITNISPAIVNLLGYQPSEVINLNISRFLTLESYAETFRRIVDRKAYFKDWGKPALNKQILESVTKNGSKKWIETISYPVLDLENNLTGFTGICRDISERMKTENLLKENEARLNDLIATKDKFFSIIAHDLRIPFNGILGFLDLLDNQYEEIEDSEKRKFIRLIAENAQNTLTLLENLLEWSKSQTGKHSFQPTNQKLKPIIDNVVGTLTPVLNLKNLALNSIVPDDLEIFADNRMLMTILHNLISNAIKYSYSEGTIEIIALPKNDEIEITVSDIGIGMSEEFSRTLFRIDEHFSTPGTSNEKGSGLGLILCKDFIEMHNGKIWVESKPEKGSRFIFTIPNRY